MLVQTRKLISSPDLRIWVWHLESQALSHCECKQTIILVHRLTTSDDYQFINAMAAVWTPCRCCGDVVT